MLIQSERHRPEDLRLWAELEAADLIHGQSATLARKVERSLSVIREFVATGPAYCCVSWGKDSLVTAHLMRTCPGVPLVYLVPTNANRDSLGVRDAYFRDFPSQPYNEHAVDYGDERSGTETERMWKAACESVRSRFGGRWITGIRQDESTVRQIRVARWGESTANACAPIARWTAADVFGYLAVHGLPVHPVYAMLGGGRWKRDRLRVDVLGDNLFGENDRGYGGGRREWEAEYYGDVLRRIEAGAHR